MERYQSFLAVCLFLVFSLPAAATGDPSSAQILPVAAAQLEQKSLPDISPQGTNSAAKVLPVVQQEHAQESTSAYPGYNLQAYNTNEVALKAVERNISLFSNTIKGRFSLWLSRSGKYLELMKEILRQKDVPENIVFLPLIESGFSPYAYSVAQASGPWQFIASTARRYGLEINWWKDERRDPVKSTAAAD